MLVLSFSRSLKSLSLEGCSHVSDTGVAELAKMCTGLTYLNISRCERVGEYGDRALIQLGRSCHQLKGLDAFGCSHAQVMRPLCFRDGDCFGFL